MRTPVMTVVIAVSLALAGSASAAPCKDAKGKFIKCPPPAAAAKAPVARCKDARGKFAKCTAPGAKAA